MRHFPLLAALLFLIFASETRSFEANQNANAFWETFRAAILTKDHRVVASLTKFPFEVRGADDSEPLRRYKEKDLPRILNEVLSQPLSLVVGGSIVETTMFDVIKEKQALVPSDFQTPTSIRVHQLVFKRIGGHWLFTRAYVEK